MAAIVKANPSLTAGGLAVLRREYSTTDDGTLNYTAEYCCLSQFANNYIGRFRTGAAPPTPIPASMSSLRIDGTPKLYDLATHTQNGLTYFNARYSAASLDGGEVIITESTEQRSFSGALQATIRTPGNLGSTITVEGIVQVSFDYISKTVRVEAKNPRNLPDIKGSIVTTFNQSTGELNGQQATLKPGQLRATTIETESKTRSSRGSYTYSRSSSGIYQAAGGGI
jgi:archaellum component FlaG (FlaF/FlaG flagellin family)